MRVFDPSMFRCFEVEQCFGAWVTISDEKQRIFQLNKKQDKQEKCIKHSVLSCNLELKRKRSESA